MGLTADELRDYYIAHAPAVPEWFKPVIPDEPQWQTNPKMKALREKPRQDWTDDDHLLDGVESAARHSHNRLHRQWQDAAQRERTLQWPLYWADEMMKRRQQAA